MAADSLMQRVRRVLKKSMACFAWIFGLSAKALLPSFVDFYARGTKKQAAGDWDGAIADYSEAIKLNPDSARAFVRRAVAPDDPHPTLASTIITPAPAVFTRAASKPLRFMRASSNARRFHHLNFVIGI